MIKVLFVILPYVVQNVDAKKPKIRSFHAFPYGVLSIATYCRLIADIKIFDMNAEDEIVPILKEFRPDIVAFSMMFDNSYSYLGECLQTARKIVPGAVMILGGAAASYSYAEILDKNVLLDAVCLSEGEIPMYDLLNSEDLHGVLDRHQSWITQKKIEEEYPAPKISFVQKLDEVVDIDYSFVDTGIYDMKEAFSPFVDHKKHRQFFIVTSRGCPFKCTFCSNSAIHGETMRFASVDMIISHVGHLVRKYKMDVLTIYDDQLLIRMNRAKEIFRRLIPFKLRIECPNGLSPAFMDDELALLMKEAGLDTAYLAIESGSKYILEDIIQKPLKLEQVEPAVSALKKAGIFTHGFFVMGMPGETSGHRKETLEFIKQSGLDWAGLNMATPTRGSKLYEDCIRNKWIEKQPLSDIVDKKYIINIPGTSPEGVEREVYMMNLDVNFVNNRRMKEGDFRTASNCFKDVIRRYEKHAFAYYYLAKCYAPMNHYPDREYHQKYMEIISSDSTWMEYARHFGLEGS